MRYYNMYICDLYRRDNTRRNSEKKRTSKTNGNKTDRASLSWVFDVRDGEKVLVGGGCRLRAKFMTIPDLSSRRFPSSSSPARHPCTARRRYLLYRAVRNYCRCSCVLCADRRGRPDTAICAYLYIYVPIYIIIHL